MKGLNFIPLGTVIEVASIAVFAALGFAKVRGTAEKSASRSKDALDRIHFLIAKADQDRKDARERWDKEVAEMRDSLDSVIGRVTQLLDRQDERLRTLETQQAVLKRDVERLMENGKPERRMV